MIKPIVQVILIFTGVMSLAAFAAFGIDKYRAIQKGRRIPERILLRLAVFGGGIGAFLGMKVFRHKTRHSRFAYGLPVIMTVQIILLGVLIWQMKT